MKRMKDGLAAAVMLLAGAGAALAETPLERGAYLVRGLAACGNCHTPQGPNGPVPGRELAGGTPMKEAAFTAYASNITPDKETGIGAWTDEEIIRAIREGKRPDGSTIGPPMPIGLYRHISDSDAKAMVAYLRSVPAVSNKVPRSEYSFPLPPAYGPPVGKVADVPKSDKLAYGAYLAGPIGHCVECHSTPGPTGAPDLKDGLGAGGMSFKGPWGEVRAPNITPSNLAGWSDAEIKRAVTQGIHKDGRRMSPPMGYGFYRNARAQDLDALVAYLRSMPAK